MKFEPVIKWSGSKRALSEQIISYFPTDIDTYYEPFCGGCSILFQLLNSNINVKEYICSDINKDLINFFNLLKTNPESLYKEYKGRWEKLKSYEEIRDKQKYYNEIRNSYNKNKNTHDFLFLTRTSTNGLIRYNSKGEFNAPFHLTRDGINPERFYKITSLWAEKLIEKNVQFINHDYFNVNPNVNDYVFLDPPYMNTKGMYYGLIDFKKYWEWMESLLCGYSLTFDGKRGETDNTYSVPNNLYSNHIYLDSKISGFQKLHKTNEYVQESLYIR